ncbi:sulfhydryl oxidase 2-like isoform X1 [Lycium barbarum]|uniref:sulfhydryl oxidase 2-like isoform X1 n=1 Tax=Lycium barbarum TaxID=112863 RepID=UPI00293E852B|nr:sulfhydryl oxidase 2-like isoform X1 [Lycium barbarum]
MNCSVFLVFLILSISITVSSGSHQRAILRAIIKENNNKDGDFAIDLNATNFDSILKETPSPFAIVEFFANWCPACRNYKPHYEKVARLFNGAGASHPGIILMTRVDCASTINSNLCDKFSVGRFPMLFWGPPKKFVGGGWDPKQEKSAILPIENFRTADILLEWINKQLGSSYGFDDGKYEKEHLQANTSDPGQIVKAIYDIEEATSTAFGIILDHKMIIPATRASLIKFLQLLVAHHPSKRCRKGSADVLVDFDDLCPSKTMLVNNEEAESCSKKGALGNYQICGKEVPRGYWMYCRGSKNDTRGFSCGLWVLLHSLSVRVEDGESDMAFRSTCDYIHNFFICEECRQHFYEMCSSVSSRFKKGRDFALWLWSAHNKVNERLMKEEASLGTGDPEFPKAIWPPKQLCSSCYLSSSKTSKENNKINWNEDEVFKFLVSYYGKELVTLHKDKQQQTGGQTETAVTEEVLASTHAVVVPVGAALAIAVASCAFGALAYIWRSRQKNRKYKYIYSLKNI